MPSVARLSACLLATGLAATLGIKALANEFTANEDRDRLDRDIARALELHGFAYRQQPEIDRPATFYASRADCRLVIRQAYEPESFDRKYRQNARTTGPLHYRIAQQRFDSPPLLTLWINDMLHLARIRLGFTQPRAPALAVALSPTCPPDALPTDRLLIHPGSPDRQG